MANQSLLLKITRRRRDRIWRRGLISFFDAVLLYLEAGYDLAFAWNEARSYLGDYLPKELSGLIELSPGEALSEHLEKQRDAFPIVSYRLWFGVLAELYGRGSSLTEVLSSMTQTFRAEESQDLDTHLQRLPGRMSILLILFFLPATFLLLFTPLLLALSHSLQ